MIEVEITNFKSIPHVKFVVDGFTTIMGSNFIGKSNVLRAINAALTNQQGSDLINWNEKFCEVHLVMEGLDLLWHKEESNNYYVINGSTYKKTGRDEPPAEILNAGFRPIKTSSQKINLNYSVQFFPLFLVDSLDSKGADLLTSVYGLDRLYKAIDLCSKAQRDNSDELKLREKDLEIGNIDLERFSGLQDITEKSESLKEIKTRLSKEETLVNVLKARCDKIQELVGVCKKLQGIKSVVLPNPDPVAKNASIYRKLVGYQESLTNIAGSVNRLKKISDVEVPPDKTPSIRAKIEEYKKLCVWAQRYDQLTADTDRLGRISAVVLPVCKVDLKDITKLRSFYDSVVRQKRDVLALKAEFEQACVEKSAVEEEKKKFKVCPACGRPETCPSCGKTL